MNPNGRVSLGIEGLDGMLDGGLRNPSICALIGTYGTGKTTLSLEFIAAGLARKEKCIYISLDERVDMLTQIMAQRGRDVRPFVNKSLFLVKLDPTNFTRSRSSRWGMTPRNFSKNMVRCLRWATVSSHRMRTTASTQSAISFSFEGSRTPFVRMRYTVQFQTFVTRWSPRRKAVSSFHRSGSENWVARSVRESRTTRVEPSPFFPFFGFARERVT